MFGMKNITKFFQKKPVQQEMYYHSINEEELEDGWIKLGTEHLEDDFVVIPTGANQKEFSIQEMAKDVEIIAKSDAYNLSVSIDKNPYTAISSEGRLEEEGYKVYQLGTHAAREKGVFLYALVNEKNEKSPITVVCRGTQMDASIIADLDPNGPGATVMQEARESILNQLNELSRDFPHRKMRVTGHSLGGSLSQILTTYLLSEKINALNSVSQYDALGKISGVDTVVFQSAGISKTLADTAKKHAVSIKSQDKEFDINFVAHVKEGDFVSRTGTYLFSDIENHIVDVSLIKRNLDKPCLTLGDCLNVGVAYAFTGPVGAVGSTIKALGVNYVNNRIQAHSDLFHHNKEHELNAQVYGIYRNANIEDRDTIKHVFEEDITANIPNSSEIKNNLHGLLSELTTDDLNKAREIVENVATIVGATVSVAEAAATVANTAASLGTKSAVETAFEVPKGAKAINVLSDGYGITLRKCGKAARSLYNDFYNMFGSKSRKDKETTTMTRDQENDYPKKTN